VLVDEAGRLIRTSAGRRAHSKRLRFFVWITICGAIEALLAANHDLTVTRQLPG
jgi:hypothetical protein